VLAIKHSSKNNDSIQLDLDFSGLIEFLISGVCITKEDTSNSPGKVYSGMKKKANNPRWAK
jgi:hypothetical protein